VKSSSTRTDETVLGGRYVLDRLVGHGSSARVYTATDRSLGRRVAVKLLHAGLASDGPFRRRFESEARHAASLNHPNLLAIYDWAEGDQVYLVTELLEGGSLRALLDAGQGLTPSQAVLVGLQAGSGLAHAHGEGFVHRDIKPANLMFSDKGRLKIADFGISRAVAEASWTEPDGALIGTARYAAPEQALGRGIDGRADIYSLGLTLIEALTGEVPLVGANPLATMVLRQDTDVVVDADLGALGDALTAAGRSDAAERPDAVEFVAMLEAVASTLPRPSDLPLAGLPSPDEAADDVIVLEAGREELVLAERATVRNPETDPTVPMPAPANESTDPEAPDAGTVEDRVGGSLPDDRSFDAAAHEENEPNRTWWWVLVGFLLVVGALFAVGRTGLFDAVLEESVPEPVTFPVGTYVGRDIAAVSSEIEANGWIVESSSTRADGSVPGEVLTQAPAAGVQREAGAVIVLVVSEGVQLRDVPSLEGLTLAEAEGALGTEGLIIGNVQREFDEVVDEGLVLRSSAEPGVQVETGDRIDLVISAGPEPRAVPDLSGRSQAEAEAALAELGLVAVIGEDYSDTVPQGMVISTDPVPASSLDRGGSVTVTVSLGLPFIRVPDVSGLSAAAAADQLTALGFVVSDTDGPPNRDVIATDPPAGDSLRKGSDIIIFTRRT
jgi:serine/threonine-protein kinase